MKTSKLVLLLGLLVGAAAFTSAVDYYTSKQATTVGKPAVEAPAASLTRSAAQAPVAREGSCVSASLAGAPRVNGLDQGIEVPLFVGAKRLSYPPLGASQYVAKASPQDILGFYQDRMRSLCWQARRQRHNQVVYEKENKVVQISVYDNPVSGKAVIDYQVLTPARVLGVATVQAAQTECPVDQVVCSDASGNAWCQLPPCPSTSGSTPPPSPTPSPTPSPSPTPAPPPSPSCSGSYQDPSSTYPNCNYSTCPSGCTWDAQGCPNGCYASSTTPPPSSTTACTGEYQQQGVNYASCDYSKCPNGCNWSNGCPIGCYTPASCSGEYQQPGSTYPSCNYSKCPNGCNYGSDGCPVSCYSFSTGSCPDGQSMCNGSCVPMGSYCPPSGGTSGDTQASCTAAGGLWCQPTTAPHCHYGPNPSPCEPDTPGGSAGMCPFGQYWCSYTNSCKPTSDTYCPPSGSTGYYPDKQSCETAGGRWCQPTTSPHCHGPGDPAPCEADTPGGGYICPAGQYMCNGVCIPTNTSCSPTTWPNDQASCVSQGKYWCTSSYSGGSYSPYNSGWCQSSPCTNTTLTCTGNTYYCPSSNSCVPSGSPCGSQTACPGNSYYCEYTHSCVPSGSICYTPPPTPVSCPQGQYWCSYSNGCVSNNISCVPPTPNPVPVPAPQQCPQGYYWCDENHSCVSNNSPCVQTNFPPGPGGPTEEEMKKWEEQQEKMQEEQERRQFEMMKRNVNQFEREMKRMTRYVSNMEKQLKRQNIGLPPELKNALTEIPNLIAQLKAAKNFEEFEDAMDKMQDVVMVVQDWNGRLHELQQLGQMLKDAERQVRDMYRSFKQLQASFKLRPELQDELKTLEAMVGVMSRHVADAKALAKSDPEEALNILQDKVFANTEEFWSEHQFLQMVGDLQKGLSMADSELRRAKSRVRKLERTKGADPVIVQEAKAILTEIEGMLPELRALVKKKPIDIDELRDKAETFWDAIQRFEETMAQAGAGIYYSPTMYAPSSKFEIDIPEGFIMPQPAGPGEFGGGELGAPGSGFGGGFPAPSTSHTP